MGSGGSGWRLVGECYVEGAMGGELTEELKRGRGKVEGGNNVTGASTTKMALPHSGRSLARTLRVWDPSQVQIGRGRSDNLRGIGEDVIPGMRGQAKCLVSRVAAAVPVSELAGQSCHPKAAKPTGQPPPLVNASG